MALATPISWAPVWLVAGLPGRCSLGPIRPWRRPPAAETGVRRLREEELPGSAGALPGRRRSRRRRPGNSAAPVLTWRSSPPTRPQRAALAEQGIAACRQAIARESNSAPAHYYLGMNLGQLAQTKGLGALRLVNQMEREFTPGARAGRAVRLRGPDRNLGLLYRDAPAIGSVGSRSKAREHLERAVELAPQYPENRLNLIEAYLKWGERNERPARAGGARSKSGPARGPTSRRGVGGELGGLGAAAEEAQEEARDSPESAGRAAREELTGGSIHAPFPERSVRAPRRSPAGSSRHHGHPVGRRRTWP